MKMVSTILLGIFPILCRNLHRPGSNLSSRQLFFKKERTILYTFNWSVDVVHYFRAYLIKNVPAFKFTDVLATFPVLILFRLY